MSEGTHSQQQPEGQRSVGFDLMRFIAALVVVIYHYSFSSNSVGRTELHSSLLAPVFRYGYTAVDIFFIISGYFIMMTALGRDWRSFMIARLSRIYPVLAICSTVTFIGCSLLGPYSYRSIGVLDWLGNATGLSLVPVIGLRIPVADVVYWTLQIEVAFYAVVALGLAAGLVQRRLLALLLVICLASMVASALMSERNLVLGAMVFLSRFIVGGVLFEVSRQPRSAATWIIGASAMTLMLISIWNQAIERVELEHAVFNPWIAVTILVVSTGVMLLFVFRPVYGSSRWVGFAGGVTYALYLVHHQLGCAIANALGQRDSSAGVLVLTAGMLALSAAIHRVENPLVARLRRVLTRIVYRHPPEIAAGGESGSQRVSRAGRSEG